MIIEEKRITMESWSWDEITSCNILYSLYISNLIAKIFCEKEKKSPRKKKLNYSKKNNERGFTDALWNNVGMSDVWSRKSIEEIQIQEKQQQKLKKRRDNWIKTEQMFFCLDREEMKIITVFWKKRGYESFT